MLLSTLIRHIQLDSTSLHLADAAFAALKKKEKTLCLEYKHSGLNVRNGTRKCASRDAVVLWTTLPLAEASTEMTIETSNPAHPESPRAFYISLLNIILCYKNARIPFVYRALRAI